MTTALVLLDLVSHLVNEIHRDSSVAPKFERVPNPERAWRSLLFCILSSQVRATTAARAVDCIVNEIPFFSTQLAATEVYDRTKRVLVRKDVRYRFPNARARQIARSWIAFSQIEKNIYAFLDSFVDEQEARSAVSRRFPGLGMKQASMFLRDIGFSDRLCIIDTHILWYCDRVGVETAKTLTPKRYLEVENYLLSESEKWGVAPNVFDSVVWAAVQTLKAKQCTMQFV